MAQSCRSDSCSHQPPPNTSPRATSAARAVISKGELAGAADLSATLCLRTYRGPPRGAATTGQGRARSRASRRRGGRRPSWRNALCFSGRLHRAERIIAERLTRLGNGALDRPEQGPALGREAYRARPRRKPGSTPSKASSPNSPASALSVASSNRWSASNSLSSRYQRRSQPFVWIADPKRRMRGLPRAVTRRSLKRRGGALRIFGEGRGHAARDPPENSSLRRAATATERSLSQVKGRQPEAALRYLARRGCCRIPIVRAS